MTDERKYYLNTKTGEVTMIMFGMIYVMAEHSMGWKYNGKRTRKRWIRIYPDKVEELKNDLELLNEEELENLLFLEDL